MSSCPFVIGSKEPANTAVFIIVTLCPIINLQKYENILNGGMKFLNDGKD
jgi:hypothetical protein